MTTEQSRLLKEHISTLTDRKQLATIKAFLDVMPGYISDYILPVYFRKLAELEEAGDEEKSSYRHDSVAHW